MKKLFLCVLLLLSFLKTEAQIPQQYNQYNNAQFRQDQSSSTVVYIPWRITNEGCYGCPSFYWSVNETYVPSVGQYKFDIWFYSNSYYATGGWASTYVQGLYFKIDGYYLYQEPSWLLFKDKYTSSLTTFYTTNPAPTVNITWTSMKVY